MQYGHKTIFMGDEGSGKTLLMSVMLTEILERNGRYFEITGIPRPIFTNVVFSKKFMDRAALLGIPVFYWTELEEWVGVSGCDVVIDEIGTYFDARLWPQVPRYARYWLAQCDKNGVNIYGTSQDFSMVDKTFRRLCKVLYSVRKVAGSPRPHFTYPAITKPWGVFFYRYIDPKGYKEDDIKESAVSWPRPFFLRKKYYSIFDTNATTDSFKKTLESSKKPKYEHDLTKLKKVAVVSTQSRLQRMLALFPFTLTSKTDENHGKQQWKLTDIEASRASHKRAEDELRS